MNRVIYIVYCIVWLIINTIHLQERGYKTRKPRLRFEILACLAQNGNLTKKTTRSLLKHGARSEIIKSFQKLESDGLIKQLDFKYARGGRQYNYKITERGLTQLIKNDPDPLKFWKNLFGYSQHIDRGLTMEEVDRYYDLFTERFLKYKSSDTFSALEFFDQLCDRWFHNTILKKDKLEIEQKVIEVLAVYPRISFKELVKRTGSSNYEAKKCLATYTLTSYRQVDKSRRYGIGSHQWHMERGNRHWKLLLHSIVVVNHVSSIDDETYELSLFGIMLALAIVSSNYLRASALSLKHGLHYQNMSFADYYDKIVRNYEYKLPLILGKWNLLKHILKLYAAYNLDIIFDKRLRSRQYSVIDGGNEESFESLQKMASSNSNQIFELLDTGELVENEVISLLQEGRYYKIDTKERQDYLMDINSDIDLQTQINSDNIHSLRKKLDEIELILNPLHRTNRERSYDIDIIPEDLNMLKKISIRFEVQFEKEITALYYLHLYSSAAFISLGAGTAARKSHHKDPDWKPKECLSLLIKNDTNKPLLREWFYDLTDEINSLQEEIYNALPKRLS
jgi:hypothetical protein